MKAKNLKIIAILISFCFLFEQSGFAQIAGQLDISSHIASLGSQTVRDKFRPLHLRSLAYDQAQNNFQLLLDKGDVKGLSQQLVKNSTHDLLQYFLVGVTLPNDSFWVNLKPDAPDNVIEPFLAQTDVGRILLEADLQLKKDTAKATSPETLEGKKYWELLYKKAGELFGNDNVTIPTLVRPWIVPDEIIIRESDTNAYIYKATLKVMLEEDYLKSSAVYNFKDPRFKVLNEYSAQLIRDGIIPKLNREVNTAKRYASLRQVYYSLILAQWFKSRFTGKNNSYAALINRRNLANLSSQESWAPRSYFEQYRQSFQEGEYSLKENIYTPYGQNIRTYTSGGINMAINMPAMGSKNNMVSSPAETRIIDIPSLSRILPLEGSPKNISVVITEGNKIEITKMQEPDASVVQVPRSPMQQASSPVAKRAPSSQSNNIKNLMFRAIFTTGFENGPAAGYKNDIALALKKGRISFISWARDPLSVLDGIDLKNGRNARRLDEPARRVYAALANSLPVANVQVLGLNPGAGGAIGDLLDISESAQIDTVSLAPIASRIILKASIDDLRRWVSDYYLKTRNKNKLPDTGKLLKDGRISLTLAFELQRAGYPVFDTRPEQNPEPFIRHQYIGEFLNKNMLLPQYDFVVDMDTSADAKKFQAAFNKVNTSLRTGGVFYASSDRPLRKGQMGQLTFDRDKFLVLDDELAGKSFMVIRKGTQYAQQVESYLKNNEVRQLPNGVYAVPSFKDIPWERFATTIGLGKGPLSDWVANNAAFPSEAYKSVPIEKWETKDRVDLKELPVGAMVLLYAAPARISYLIRIEKEGTVSLWVNGQDGYFSGSTDLLASFIPGERESQKGVIETGKAVGLPYFVWEGGNLVRSSEPGRSWWTQSFSTTWVLTPEIQKASSSPIKAELPDFTSAYLQEKSGWMASSEYLGWLGRINTELRLRIGQKEPVTVYYYGMGGGGSEYAPGGVDKIDIISPLLATDFDRLYSFDKGSPKYSAFKSAVIRELAIAGIGAEGISFEELSPSSFQFRFSYNDKLRTVTIAYGKDATKEYPIELDKGYTTLYSRGIPIVFRDMDPGVKERLLNKLDADKGLIVLESLPRVALAIEGFQRLDLGDTSWAGEARRLDVFARSTASSPAGQNYQKGMLELFTEKQRKDLIDRLRKGATEAEAPFDGNEIIKIGHEIIDVWQGTETTTEKFLGELGKIDLLIQKSTPGIQNKLRPIVQNLKDYVEFSRQRGPFSTEGEFASSPVQKKEEWARRIDNINGDPAKTAELLDGLASITDPQDGGFISDLRLRAIEKSVIAANSLKTAERRTNFENKISTAANKRVSVSVVKEEGPRGNYIRVGRLIVINSKLIMPQEIRQRMQNDLVIEITGPIDYLPYLVPMLDAMQNTDFRGKTVIDYGTGSGVLGLVALRLGAKRVIAIDSDLEGLMGDLTEEGRVNAEHNLSNAGYTTAFVDKVTPEQLAQAKAQCIFIHSDLRDWFKNESEFWQWISAGNEVIRLAHLGYSYRVHTPLMLHLLSESVKTPVIIGGYIQGVPQNTPENILDVGMEEMSPEKALKTENDNPLPHMLTEIFGKESSDTIISRLGIDKAWLGYQTDQFLFTFYNRIIGKKESINWNTDLGAFRDTNAKIYYALRATPQPVASSPVVDIQADNIDSKFMFFNEETKELSYGGVKLDFFKEGGSNLMYLLGDSIIRVAKETHGPEILLPNYMRMGAEGFAPEVLASGFTGGGDKEGHFFVAVPRVYGESLMDLERLNTEQKAIFLEFLGRMIARGVYINDFNMKQFMYGSIKDGAKRMWLVDPEWAKTLTPQRALEWYSQVMDTYLEVLNESKDDPAVIEKERQFFLMVKEYLTKVDLQSLLKYSAGSSPILQETNDKGGIDFRSLPITTQPMLPTAGGNASPFNPNLANLNLDKEWAEIQKMLNAGITPSSDRIKEYAQVCSQSQDADKELAKVVSCIADILRMEEEKCVPSEGALTDLLMVLESGKITSEVPGALDAISTPSRAPQLVRG